MLAKVAQAGLRSVAELSVVYGVGRYRRTQVVDRSSSNLFACPVIVAPALGLVLADEQLELLLYTAGSIPH